ncbi:hypothetical protein I6N95_04935 [Vagococcus sp. BWB3-3]|uniref:Uncharacterized protein n=2 Tax=Vagococcus allomyrinae TaxID=2794353 RepID=A0A940P2P4_9ENTE|nr:hypothetical protein [Vagococcus allomyrinae]
MGSLQRSQIVKVLSHHSFSYEIRLDETFCHHRIIFFLYSKLSSAFAMTFGFTKVDNDKKSDYTDLCAAETDRIVIDIIENENDHYWLGADINES